MIVVKKLSSEFKIKLVVKFSDTLTDMLGLHFQIFFIIESNFFHTDFPLSCIVSSIYADVCRYKHDVLYRRHLTAKNHVPSILQISI